MSNTIKETLNIPFVDLKKQYQGIALEIDAVIAEVISKTAFISGPYAKKFEKAFAEFCGARYCVGVGNGTDALYIALRALDIGPGDEVITAANSFIATSEAISTTGARVVFADINPETYNIDPDDVRSKLTEKTSAIIPVHLYGQPVDMDQIMAIAKEHNLKIVEDCAQAHGALYKGTPVGTFGDFGCFSFYPGKNLGAYGDGGGIVTNDEQLATRARMIANHGRVEKYNHELEGVNSRMDGIQAGVLSVKLKYLPDWNENRRKAADLYGKYLDGIDVGLPQVIEDVVPVYHLYVVRVRKEWRSRIQEYLKDQGISTGIHYPIALHELKAYKYLGHRPDDYPEASSASGQILSLPMYPEITESEVRYVAEKLGHILSELSPE